MFLVMASLTGSWGLGMVAPHRLLRLLVLAFSGPAAAAAVVAVVAAVVASAVLPAQCTG